MCMGVCMGVFNQTNWLSVFPSLEKYTSQMSLPFNIHSYLQEAMDDLPGASPDQWEGKTFTITWELHASF